MLTKERTAELVNKFGGSEKNSGKTEVQVAIITERINYLSNHFADHKLDFHSKRGLMKLIGRRRRLLKYLNGKSPERYKAVIKELGLRK
ncbi:MAG: 30S ribosomal protein S15 [Bacteriovoracaceae bacterium]|jgi:small subunit ribosomal protein S15|nr:30S ribosomal protein S15 [Halobacteriovoraceae bacterium]MDP7320899.1 30S ribosomal protein S15 [Bacteriovoracaceae bacterium]